VALLLLEQGADLSAKTNGETWPLHGTILHPFESLVVLLESRADLSTAFTYVEGRRIVSPLNAAALPSRDDESTSSLIYLLRLEASANNGGMTPLHFAALRNHKAVARLLLRKGADLHAKTNDGRTPEEVSRSIGMLSYPGKKPWFAAMLKAEAERRAKCEAFAMGQLERLGEGSRVRGLEAGVVQALNPKS
jgi:ankyrin repeat protein